MRPWLLASVLLLAQADPQPVQRMAAAERAFAAAAAEQGWRDAALRYLAPDAVTLTVPLSRAGEAWSSARATLEALPLTKLPVATREVWEPLTGQVSSDGSLGWLIGARAALNLPIRSLANQGAFFHVWRRQPDGTWLLWLTADVRFPNVWQTDASFSATPAPDEAADGAAGESLEAAERSVSGGGMPWARRLALGVQLHRAGTMPLIGRAAVTDWAQFNWRDGLYDDVRTVTAASGDLGIAYGTYRLDGGRQRGTWARAWHRDLGGRWRIVFETSQPARPGA